MCFVAWPLNESEAGVDLVFVETSQLFYVNDAALRVIISRNLYKQSSEVSTTARSPPAHVHSNAR